MVLLLRESAAPSSWEYASWMTSQTTTSLARKAPLPAKVEESKCLPTHHDHFLQHPEKKCLIWELQHLRSQDHTDNSEHRREDNWRSSLVITGYLPQPVCLQRRQHCGWSFPQSFHHLAIWKKVPTHVNQLHQTLQKLLPPGCLDPKCNVPPHPKTSSGLKRITLHCTLHTQTHTPNNRCTSHFKCYPVLATPMFTFCI